MNIKFFHNLPSYITPVVEDGVLSLLTKVTPGVGKTKVLRVEVSLSPENENLESESFWERKLLPMMNNLAGAVFEEEFPDIFIKMLRRQAIAMRDKNLPFDPIDEHYWRRYKELHSFMELKALETI